MTWTDDLAKRLREGERELLVDLGRVRAALRILEDGKSPEVAEGSSKPSPTVVRLPAAPRELLLVREAAADDVLALVATGVTSSVEIRRQLDTDHSSVIRRLYELRRDGMVEQIRGGWYPTNVARSLNWIELRAREIIRRLEA